MDESRGSEQQRQRRLVLPPCHIPSHFGFLYLHTHKAMTLKTALRRLPSPRRFMFAVFGISILVDLSAGTGSACRPQT